MFLGNGWKDKIVLCLHLKQLCQSMVQIRYQEDKQLINTKIRCKTYLDISFSYENYITQDQLLENGWSNKTVLLEHKQLISPGSQLMQSKLIKDFPQTFGGCEIIQNDGDCLEISLRHCSKAIIYGAKLFLIKNYISLHYKMFLEHGGSSKLIICLILQCIN